LNHRCGFSGVSGKALRSLPPVEVGAGELDKLDDKARSVDRVIRLPERFDYTLATAICRSEIDEKNLVEFMMNDVRQQRATLDQLGFVELTFEDAVLQMIAPIPHGLVNLAKSLIIANVVANEIGMSHRRHLPN
jgi:hypothetical protein